MEDNQIATSEEKTKSIGDFDVKIDGMNEDLDVKNDDMKEKVIAECEEETKCIGEIGVNNVGIHEDLDVKKCCHGREGNCRV